MGERHVYTVNVGGSNPSPTTINIIMITEKDCYYRIGTTNNTDYFLNYFKSNNQNLAQFKLTDVLVLFGIPDEIWKKDRILSQINNIFKIERCGLLRLDPKGILTYHTDATRDVCLNLLLTPNIDSNCYFTDNPYNSSIKINLVYEPDTWYLFNTSKYHSVTNNSNQTRFLLSVDFERGSNDLKFQDILEGLQSLTLS